MQRDAENEREDNGRSAHTRARAQHTDCTHTRTHVRTHVTRGHAHKLTQREREREREREIQRERERERARVRTRERVRTPEGQTPGGGDIRKQPPSVSPQAARGPGRHIRRHPRIDSDFGPDSGH